jgi:hypothetical protein
MDAAVMIHDSFGGPISCPRLRDWVTANPERVREAIPVMHDVYKSFLDEPDDMPVLEENHHTHMGFAAGIYRESDEYRGVGLQVLGNCACLGINPMSHKVKGGSENGFVEYDLHNADTNAQRVSLFAGLGYLATLASAPEQFKLF